jgi:hypothetical protein
MTLFIVDKLDNNSMQNTPLKPRLHLQMMLMAGLNVLSFNGWFQHFIPEGALFLGCTLWQSNMVCWKISHLVR